MDELQYDRSAHVTLAATSSPGATEPPVLAEVPQLTYDKTDRSAPQGTPSDQLPPVVRELREQDDARRMYSPQVTYRDVIKEGESATDQEKLVAAELREIFADAEMSAQEASELVAVAQGLTELPTAETKAAWETQAWTELRRQYGEDGAKEALADAQRLIVRDPRVARLLAETGLGSHPAYVLRAVQTARNQRGRY